MRFWNCTVSTVNHSRKNNALINNADKKKDKRIENNWASKFLESVKITNIFVTVLDKIRKSHNLKTQNKWLSNSKFITVIMWFWEINFQKRHEGWHKAK